jgi:5'-methylthioadenosine phosphorylase
VSEGLIGIIGGTGLGEELAKLEGAERIALDTPYGAPSDALVKTAWRGSNVVFLNRHGPGHTIAPSSLPNRANIFALKQLGVSHVIASGAVGSLREHIKPGHLVICDQVIDKTSRRTGTFFDDGLAVHVEMADPFCASLRRLLLTCASQVDTKVHDGGTYVVMEGPQFSTRAESEMHRAWGGDLIGMTCMPEAKLAREAGMCYALVALATDYDCWRVQEKAGDKQALLAEIVQNLQKAAGHAVKLIEAAVARLHSGCLASCACAQALDLAIWSDKSQVKPEMVERLQPLLGRYFQDAS